MHGCVHTLPMYTNHNEMRLLLLPWRSCGFKLELTMLWVAVVQHYALHKNHVDPVVMFVTYVPKERIPSERILPTLELCFCTII